MNSLSLTQKTLSTILAAASLLGAPALAQKLNDRVGFETSKEWKSSRWYLIGKWVSSSQILWLDGKRTSVNWADPVCLKSPYIPRIESRDGAANDLEVLRSSAWIAIEINPVVVQENFQLSVRKSKDGDYCKASLPLSTALSGGAGSKPLLVLQPTGSSYFGKNIDIKVVDPSELTGLQLDIMMGYWYAQLKNAQALNAASKLHLFPVATARLEWLTSERARWGSHLFLEQSGNNWGAKTSQNLILSNWGLGGFFQHFIRVKSGLKMRYYVEYSQFRADDGQTITSVAPQNVEARYFNLGIMSHLYLKGRWSGGIEAKYGYPTEWPAKACSNRITLVNLN